MVMIMVMNDTTKIRVEATNSFFSFDDEDDNVISCYIAVAFVCSSDY